MIYLKYKMSSRQKYEGYATYSTYNGGDSTPPQQTQASSVERFSNAPPPVNPPPPQAYPSQMIRSVAQPMNGPSNLYDQRDQRPSQGAPPQQGPPPQQQGPPQQYPQQGPPPQQGPQQQQGPPVENDIPHRIRTIPVDKLYELLTNKSHFFIQNQQPLRIFIKISTDWCKPCIKIKPEVKKISMNPKYASILFVELNGDELTQHEKLSSKLKVSAVPSFFGFVAGQQVGFMAGADVNDIVKLCDKIASV